MNRSRLLGAICALLIIPVNAIAATLLLDNYGDGPLQISFTREAGNAMLTRISVGSSDVDIGSFGTYGEMLADGNLKWAVFLADPPYTRLFVTAAVGVTSTVAPVWHISPEFNLTLQANTDYYLGVYANQPFTYYYEGQPGITANCLTSSAGVVGDNGNGSNFNDPVAEEGGVVQVSAQIYGPTVTPTSLTITKVSEPAEVVAGGAFQYIIDVSNGGTEDATLVTVSDTLPAGVTLLAPLPFGCNEPVPGTVNCSLGTLGPGAGAQVVLNVLAPDTPGVTLVNTASASSEGSTSVADEAQTLLFDSNADVWVSKTANLTETEAGEESFAYSVFFNNGGPGPATGVTLNDPLPDGMLFEDATSTHGDCSHDVVTNTVNCAIGDLPPITDGKVTINATPVQVGLISNTATIAATGPDPRPENNESTTETLVVFSRASITDTINTADDRLLDFGLVALGQSVTGNLVVSNTGTTPLTIGNILEPLQPPFSVVSAGCFGAVLLPGDSCSVIIQFSPVENGYFPDGFDLVLDAITVPVAVSGRGGTFTTDIAVTKEADRVDVSVGDVINFTITVQNLGDRETGGVTAAVKVTDKLPAPLRIPDGQAATVSQGFYSPSTGEWFVGDLAVGDPPARLEIPALVSREPPGGRHCITNVAVTEITSPDVTEPTNGLSNNRAEKMIGIDGCSDLAITQIDQEADVLPDTTDFTWPLTVINNGVSELLDPVLVYVELPMGAVAGVTFPISLTMPGTSGFPSEGLPCSLDESNSGLLTSECHLEGLTASTLFPIGVARTLQVGFIADNSSPFDGFFRATICAAGHDPEDRNNAAAYRERPLINQGSRGRCGQWQRDNQ